MKTKLKPPPPPKQPGSKVPGDPPGVWRQELQCAGCGTCKIIRTVESSKSLPLSSWHSGSALGPPCKGFFNGRPKNRCSWPTSPVWLFVPEQPL
jgi:hypothetical protein